MKIRLAQNRPQNDYMPIQKKGQIQDCFFSFSLTLRVCEQFFTYFSISQLTIQRSWLKIGSIYVQEQFDVDVYKNLDLAGLKIRLIALKGSVGPLWRFTLKFFKIVLSKTCCLAPTGTDHTKVLVFENLVGNKTDSDSDSDELTASDKHQGCLGFTQFWLSKGCRNGLYYSWWEPDWVIRVGWCQVIHCGKPIRSQW